MKRSTPQCLVLCGLILAFATASRAADIGSVKTASSLGVQWYGALEMRHHVNTFYDQDDYLAGQHPSLHTRLKLGLQLYDRMLDLYGTLGVYKEPRSQTLVQRRPEIEADLYLIHNEYLTLLQYNLVKLPFAERETMTVEDTEEGKDGVSDGTVYVVGIAPMLYVDLSSSVGRFRPKFIWDGWTKLFSRTPYTDDYDFGSEERDYSLYGSEEQPKPIEDFAMHYYSLMKSGFEYEPAGLEGLVGEVTGSYMSKFEPKYQVDGRRHQYEYGADRHSYYRLRVRYDFDARWSITNDFYQYFGGLFESKRREEDRRYRNIARLTCKL